ncbi:MAG: RNA polymerase-binding protein DksA [Zetaproteobacteria bacterium CG06_land_8_20_14_3_00_59_53]|nr:MAG: RNA polymerase-binding protein DksA [Zetaproteobacteria bacterium CG23_combo_of_CG06-09_8_20_14_all_59_86]PIQ64495.1 MAG: RNA polymerase-binding protein DksA [Zetaproteobacteria bacterium CG11_big_fil_rev_8_21_14_0_20_59_439]PIU70922.1 MAG: RNA polymerase-binding protein DksA [Zetaproteobacteria bacterium CG06_land_8_20_14_3_00_59_53]PIU96361.1 MAG: RNA polymerase-binding protein DksA [Zetaproteobacteria bacterium CG03_land_8_20_14_0_80_59_51]PIY45201.1 MAG: RNA polymerase-binding prote
MGLNAKQIEAFTEQLLEWRNELEGGLNNSMQSMHREEQASFPDPTDQATMESDRDFDLRIRDRERRLIRKIDQAMGRIKDGTFGICDSCGGDISSKRLQARPVTTLCIDCKTAQEIEERTRTD